MPLDKLDHYTVLTDDVDGSARFYQDVLGLRVGDRPPFEFPGAWLYCGDTAVLHLIGGRPAPTDGSGHVDHIAFRASDYADVKARLKRHQVKHREQTVPGLGLRQVFVDCPEGVCLELIFRPEDVTAAGTAGR